MSRNTGRRGEGTQCLVHVPSYRSKKDSGLNDVHIVPYRFFQLDRRANWTRNPTVNAKSLTRDPRTFDDILEGTKERIDFVRLFLSQGQCYCSAARPSGRKVSIFSMVGNATRTRSSMVTSSSKHFQLRFN